MSSFAKNLRRIRKANLLTQDELAQKINVTRQAVSNWERGCSEPDIQTLIALAEALQVDANELIFGRKAECVHIDPAAGLVSLPAESKKHAISDACVSLSEGCATAGIFCRRCVCVCGGITVL